MTFHGINDKIYFDDNKNIGIGITNPSTNFHISSTDGIVIPVGTSAQRIDVTGAIRYNTDNATFEGFKGTWGSLGGIIDVDQDTYIEAETSAGTDNDDLKFFTSGTERMKIDSNGNTIINSDLIVDTNLLFVDASSNLVNVNGDLDIWGKARFESTASYIESGVLSLSNTLTGPVIDSTGTDIRLSSTGNTGALTINSSGNTSLTGALSMGDNNINTVKQLQLDSDNVTNKFYLTRSDSSVNGFVIIQSTAQVVTLNQSENANMNLSTNNITRLRLEAGGDINCMSNNITDVADISFTSATIKGHMIPDTDDAYDIGSAEFKIRDMYVSDNSLWVGDSHKVSISDGKMKFRKRRVSSVPAAVTAAGGDEDGALSHSGKSSLTNMKLKHWKAYMRSLSGQSTARIQDIFRDNDADYDEQSAADNWLENGTKTYCNIGNVGIGTNNPLNELVIQKDQNDFTTLEIRNNNTNNDTSGSQILFGGYRDTAQTTHALALIRCLTQAGDINQVKSGALSFHIEDGNNSDGTAYGSLDEMMRLTSTGLGIGINNPTDKLHIYENANDSIQLKIQNDQVSSRAGIALVNGSGTFNIQCNSGWGVIENYGNEGIHFFQKGSGNFLFKTTDSNHERFEITTGGLVGIGCTPNASLEIEKVGPVIRLTDSRSNYGSASGVELGAIEFYSKDSSAPNDYAPVGKIKIVSDNTTVAPDGAMVFLTGINGVLSERMRLPSGGNLEVSGDIEASGNIRGKQHYADIPLSGCTNSNAGNLYKHLDQSGGTWRTVYLKHGRTDETIPKVGTEYTWNRSFSNNFGFDDSNTTNTSSAPPDDMYKLKCTVKGLYMVSYNIKHYTSNGDTYGYAKFEVNGTGTDYGYAKVWCISGRQTYLQGHDVVKLEAGDYIRFMTYTQTASSSHDYNGGRATMCLLGTF